MCITTTYTVICKKYYNFHLKSHMYFKEMERKKQLYILPRYLPLLMFFNPSRQFRFPSGIVSIQPEKIAWSFFQWSSVGNVKEHLLCLLFYRICLLDIEFWADSSFSWHLKDVFPPFLASMFSLINFVDVKIIVVQDAMCCCSLVSFEYSLYVQF